mmetsp:Transcript_126665/g.246864  ORF Transcript_126665/g.246864 Transcript_126665/m.246864 type:complete len:564 (-) Transcript_126665:65-1756(-)
MGVDTGNQNLLAPLVERLRLERNACKAEAAGASSEVTAARSREEELLVELATCRRDRAAADRAVTDAESRSQVARGVLTQAEQRSNAAAAALAQKDAQLGQLLECISFLQKKIAEHQLEASRLQQDLDETRARHQSELNSLHARVESARAKAESAKAGQSALAVERNILRSDLEKAHAAKEEQGKRMVSLRSMAATASSDAKASRAQLDRLRHELREAALREAQCRKESDSRRTLAASAKECKNARVERHEKPQNDETGHAEQKVEANEKKEEQEEQDEEREELEEKQDKEDSAQLGIAAARLSFVSAAHQGARAAAAAAAAAEKPDFVSAKPPGTPMPALPVVPRTATAATTTQQPNQCYPAAAPIPQLSAEKPHDAVPVSRAWQQFPSTMLRKPSRVLHFKRSRSRIWRVEQPRCQPKREVRRGRIERKDIARVGYTAGCPGCESIRNQTPRTGHSDICRERVMKDMERLQLPAARRLVDGERRVREQARPDGSFVGGREDMKQVSHLARMPPSDRAGRSNQHGPQVHPQAMRHLAQPRLIVSSSGQKVSATASGLASGCL